MSDRGRSALPPAPTRARFAAAGCPAKRIRAQRGPLGPRLRRRRRLIQMARRRHLTLPATLAARALTLPTLSVWARAVRQAFPPPPWLACCTPCWCADCRRRYWITAAVAVGCGRRFLSSFRSGQEGEGCRIRSMDTAHAHAYLSHMPGGRRHPNAGGVFEGRPRARSPARRWQGESQQSESLCTAGECRSLGFGPTARSRPTAAAADGAG